MLFVLYWFAIDLQSIIYCSVAIGVDCFVSIIQAVKTKLFGDGEPIFRDEAVITLALTTKL